MKLKDELLNVDRHTFRAPVNVQLPDSIGMYLYLKRKMKD